MNSLPVYQSLKWRFQTAKNGCDHPAACAGHTVRGFASIMT
ncbi:hypothetical protein [Burkholderia sp. Bp8963]|nr:hypothetical protein [Burkholderia sp. Bp8963]